MDTKSIAEGMRKLLAADARASYVLKDLALLGKAHDRLDLYRRWVAIRGKFGRAIARADVEAVYLSFQQMGLGKLKVGVGNGEHSRFICAQPGAMIRDAARLALEHESVYSTMNKPSVGSLAAIVLSLSSGRELRLTLQEAKELKEHLSNL